MNLPASPSVAFRIPRRFWAGGLVVCGVLLLGYGLIPLPSPLFPANYSTVVLGISPDSAAGSAAILRVFLNRDEQWCLPPRADLPVPEKLATAVRFYEDQYFHFHPGINPVSLLRAAYQNWRSGRTVSGASTLTMQVARLMDPKPRTYSNKFLEILQALKLEVKYSKTDLLRLYLDHAPYGGNVVGYQAAALRYFQKMPYELTWGEAATLAVLPNAPGLISPQRDSQKLEEKRNRLLDKLRAKGIIDASAWQAARREPVPDGSVPFPWLAPHLGQFLKDRHGHNGGVIRTTVQPGIQQRTQHLVQRHAQFLHHLGIQNAAALVVETRSGKVRAYCGSQDFFDAAANGQVDGVRAPRSSGSLLKPFLYGLAMDEGLVLPQSLLQDVPTFYGAFSPSNADETFSGVVTAQQALIQSLNVPAARLLYTYGVYPFYLFLRSAGVSTLFRTAEDYGLPLILGGAEVTLWDMANLYRGLGNGGKFGQLQFLADDAPTEAGTTQLISPGASYLTLGILRELKRPGAEYYWEYFQNRYPLAWKTGTSYGQRDAWAVGVSPQWTVAVWVGNFSGEGNANLAGSRCAGPLLFDIFNDLPKDPRYAWFSAPDDDLAPIEICRESGFLSNGDCPDPVFAPAPRHARPLRQCPYHQRIYVSTEREYAVCSLCWTPGQYRAQTVRMYPPDVVQYLRETGRLGAAPPRHNPDCPAQTGEPPLEIVYPTRNARLWLPRDFAGERQKLTARAAHRERQRTLYWYLNDRYLGSTVSRHELALDCPKGWNVLEVVDAVGYRARTRFFVQMRN